MLKVLKGLNVDEFKQCIQGISLKKHINPCLNLWRTQLWGDNLLFLIFCSHYFPVRHGYNYIFDIVYSKVNNKLINQVFKN